jgi:hypothetical protein
MIEVLKQALEALEFHSAGDEIDEQIITSLRQAIAELESQEPVAWADMGTRDVDNDAGLSWTTGHFHTTPLYIHPPQRTWQGLTIDEREQIQQECFGKVPHHVAFAHAVEAKLKEKNNA